jgi:creatinine amidohydrolase/Fe(II)-dependent formamide hydrolase-like protein
MRRTLMPAARVISLISAVISLVISLVAVNTIPIRAAQAPAAPAAARVLMDEMTMTEVREAIASGKTTVLLFNGSTEQTGPHVVLGKHNFKARYLGERMARELGNALVAPVMPFAPTSGELMKFPGTIDLSPETFSKVNEEVTASLVKAGFKYVILLGDHGGNQDPLKTLAPRLDERYRSQGVRVFFSGDSYAKSDAEVEAYLNAHGFPPSNHGGVADTSELWAVSAAYVRPAKIAMGDPVKRDAGGAVIGPTGVEGDPRRSSAALGKMFNDIKVKNGVAEIRRLIAAASAR